ncbi:hypothetical protein, partial [Thermophagus xiamenensis]|uniref:hypothetical protein n=1 Tax=Thermophagus xiamenensis TaxID=385682 RepID=UPI001C31B36E
MAMSLRLTLDGSSLLNKTASIKGIGRILRSRFMNPFDFDMFRMFSLSKILLTSSSNFLIILIPKAGDLTFYHLPFLPIYSLSLQQCP